MKARVVNNTLFFGLSDGSSVTCECIKDSFARALTDDINRQEPARSLAAYALNLLHGATLADFEREHLIGLAKDVGCSIGPSHIEMARKRDNAEADREAELMFLRATVAYRCPASWWERLLGRCGHGGRP